MGSGRVDGWRASAEASFGIGESSDKEIRMGAQAERRAREALRPYGLFVSTTCGELGVLAHISPEALFIF